MKDTRYSDTLYVSELVASATVNTMPAATMEAFADHGVISSESSTRRFAEPAALFEALGEVGIDMNDVFARLEREGVAKFDTAGIELITAMGAQLASR